jgi:uncharacterized protein (DUF1778 family)
MATPSAPRETTVNLRAPAAQKALIDRAAEVLGQTRSSFMLEASVQRAESVLADASIGHWMRRCGTRRRCAAC